jgi:PAS domain S-box-containing protein
MPLRVHSSLALEPADLPAANGGRRKSGIELVGPLAWGTHGCQLYESSAELLEVLVPYFQAGLEENEQCLWITGERLGAEQASAALRVAVPDLDERLRRGQLEIRDYRHACMAAGASAADRAVHAWIEKQQQALARGCDGLRVASDASWLVETSDGSGCAAYETLIDQSTESQRLIVLCTYDIQKCSAVEVMEVVNNHQFTVLRRAGRWEVLESRERQRADERMAQHTMILDGIHRICREASVCQTEAQLGRLCLHVAQTVTRSVWGLIGEAAEPPNDEGQVRLEHALQSICGQVLEEGRGLVTNDLAMRSDAADAHVGHPPLTAFLGVPLRSGQKVIGMIGVGRGAGRYGPEDLATLEALADPVAQVLLRRRTEARTAQLATFLLLAPLPIIEVNQQGRLSFANPSAQQLFPDLVAGATGHPLFAHWERVAETCQGDSQDLPEREVLVNGRWYRQVIYLLPATRHVRIYNFDITARRQAEQQNQQLIRDLEERVSQRTEQLRAAHEIRQAETTERIKSEEATSRLAAIVESSDDAIVSKTLDGIITSWNQAAEKMYGYSAKEAIGKSVEMLAPPDRPNEVFGILDKIRRGQHVAHHETVRVRKDGQHITVSLTVSPVKDPAGKVVVGAATIARDVTQRKRLEEELHITSAYARSLIEASLDPLVTISPEGKITDVNRATELATGVARENLIGSDFSSYFTQPQMADEGYRRVLADGLVRNYPLTMRHVSGRTLEVLYNAAVYKDSAGARQGVFAAARDITQSKAAERRQVMTNSLLALFARTSTRKEYLGSVADVIARWSGCRCAGVRLLDPQGNAPYASAIGFSREFLELESLHCARQRHALCVRVMRGTPEPGDASWLTPCGSFRVDNATRFASSLPPDCQDQWPGTCVRAGFASIAVVPIRYRGETLGAIQLADEREGMVPASSVEFIEAMSPLIGEAIHRFNAEAELDQYREQLEELVRQRTEELQRSEALLRSVTDTTEDAIYAKDRLSRLVFVNQATLRFVGKSLDQVLGRTDAELFDDPALGAAIVENDRQVLAAGVPQVFEELFDTPQGRRIMLSSKVPWRNHEGEVIGLIGVSRDMTDRKHAEQELRESEQRVRASLCEKEVMLKEIHHRVKNNMQVISSLVALQADRAPEPAMRAVLADVTHRVRSMALVHEKLYHSTDLAQIDFAEYARSLLSYLWRAHPQAASRVRLNLELQPVPLSVNAAVPCGLILNELASNALTHAFPSGDGEVTVSLQGLADGRVCLRVRDNGVGLPPALDWRQANSLGLHLVQMLSGQLQAVVDVTRTGGTEFTVTFGEPQP